MEVIPKKIEAVSRLQQRQVDSNAIFFCFGMTELMDEEVLSLLLVNPSPIWLFWPEIRGNMLVNLKNTFVSHSWFWKISQFLSQCLEYTNSCPQAENIYSASFFSGHLAILNLRKSAFKNTDTHKDRNVGTKQVWLDYSLDAEKRSKFLTFFPGQSVFKPN